MPAKDLYVELCKSSELLLPKQDRSTILQALRQTIPEPDLRIYFLLSFGESLPLAKLYTRAARLKMTPAEVDEALQRLYREFFVMRYEKPDGIHYERCPLTMTAEQQVRAKKGSSLGKLYADYWIKLTVDTVKVLPTRTPYLPRPAGGGLHQGGRQHGRDPGRSTASGPAPGGAAGHRLGAGPQPACGRDLGMLLPGDEGFPGGTLRETA